MWFLLALERDRSWAAAWQHTDPRHPCYNGARAKLAPEPVIVECSGLGGGDLQLAQQWHVCIKTNKHNQRIYGPSMALVEEKFRLPDKSMIHLTGLGLTKLCKSFLSCNTMLQIARAAGILFYKTGSHMSIGRHLGGCATKSRNCTSLWISLRHTDVCHTRVGQGL